MIDKISGNGNYEFPGGKKRKNPAVRAYENTPGAGGEARKGAAKKAGAFQSDKKDTGVVLDLSKHAGRQRTASVSRQKKESSLPGALRKLLTPVVQWLKAFWGPGRSEQEQEEQPAQEAGAEGIAGQEAGVEGIAGQETGIEGIAGQEQMQAEESEDLSGLALSEEGNVLNGAALPGLSDEALAKQVLKSGDLRQVERFLTQNGTKRLAHNSDLLTYYDRRGKFVEMDETEKHRVLYGDKNVLKL